MDNLTKEQRHKNMKNIRSKDTKIEVVLRKALWSKGYRYRKNCKDLPGKPDIALTKYKIAIFCDSEYFHGKDWYEVWLPRIRRGNNPEYWEKKITRNMARDLEINKELEYLGWTVIRFWGKDILKNTDECVAVIEEYIFQQKIAIDDYEEAEIYGEEDDYEEAEIYEDDYKEADIYEEANCEETEVPDR